MLLRAPFEEGDRGDAGVVQIVSPIAPRRPEETGSKADSQRLKRVSPDGDGREDP